jgi:pimeloyl-ACP methyl ester carboxylesterase
MTIVFANDVALSVERFGDPAAPLVVLVGGTTMLSWPDALCERLEAGGRQVIRYDLRDSGQSETHNPEQPAYNLRDLATDAALLAQIMSDRPAHLAGIGVGGMVAQVAVLDHPESFSALTLVSTRAVAPGPIDNDLPDHHQHTMGRLFARQMPDWSDRAAVADFAAFGAQVRGDDPVAAHRVAGRIWDRAQSTAPEVQMANNLGLVFAASTAHLGGASGWARSIYPRLSFTVATTPSSRSATARRSPAKYPERSCSYSRTLLWHYPTRPPKRWLRPCSRSEQPRQQTLE